MIISKVLRGALVGACLIGSATFASAAVIDFTNATTGLSGSAAGADWSVSAGNTTQLYDGVGTPASSLGLAFEKDGLGVGDDEIATTESIILTFSKPVRVLAFAFLDLFRNSTSALTGEIGVLTINGIAYEASFDPLAPGGYAESFLPAGLIASVIEISVRNSNDSLGVADGAFAGLEVAPVPLPASGLLLLGGLGLAAMARRRKA